jgi:hypothetical protein
MELLKDTHYEAHDHLRGANQLNDARYGTGFKKNVKANPVASGNPDGYSVFYYSFTLKR